MNDITTTQYTKQDIQNMLNKNNGLDSNKLRKTNLTPQQAYNILYEINEIPKCSGCQKDLRFGSLKVAMELAEIEVVHLKKRKQKLKSKLNYQ